jgi:hypothetical protein
MLNEYRVHLHIYGIGNCDVITDGKTILDIGFSPAHLEDYI